MDVPLQRPTLWALATALVVGALAASVTLADGTTMDATETSASPVVVAGAGPAGLSGALSYKLVNTGATGPELNVGVTSNGYIFLGGWDRIARSTDDGETWTLHGTTPGVNFAADRVLIVDKDTDRVYVDDTTLGCTILAWSDDYAETWSFNPIACGGGATDHQKIAVGPRTTLTDPTGQLYPNIVYVCANGLTHTPCAASSDGGQTFGPGMPSMQLDLGGGASSTTCAFQGTPVANEQGILYQPRTQCGAALWWSEDNGLTWTHSDLPFTPSPDTPDVATTPDGSVYFFATGDDWMPYYLHSPDGGRTWNEPVSLAAPGLTSSLFPVVTAGDDGRIAIAYYGTTDDDDGWNHNPGGAPNHVRWHLYSAVVTAADTATPLVDLVQVTPDADPIQYGCLSKLGGCLGNIADYIDIDVGPDGRAYIGYVDGCPIGCGSAGASVADDGWVAVQDGGAVLRS